MAVATPVPARTMHAQNGRSWARPRWEWLRRERAMGITSPSVGRDADASASAPCNPCPPRGGGARAPRRRAGPFSLAAGKTPGGGQHLGSQSLSSQRASGPSDLYVWAKYGSSVAASGRGETPIPWERHAFQQASALGTVERIRSLHYSQKKVAVHVFHFFGASRARHMMSCIALFAAFRTAKSSLNRQIRAIANI